MDNHPNNTRATRSLGPIGIVLTVLALAALFVTARLPATAKTQSQKAAGLLDGLTKANNSGLAVLVAQNGRILFEKGYGLADREHNVPITPLTTFRIASVTKQFTAVAILKLQEEGKLSIGDKLSKYIPDFPRGDEVTLRQLLTHTSGIYNYNKTGYFALGATNPTTIPAIIGTIEEHPYDFDPGTKWSYDNSGYLLLGYIVEKVSRKSYADFLRENFFQPLGMTNTGVYHAHLGLPHEALGYSLSRNGLQRAFNWDPTWTGGNGALYSTVEDLYRWNEGIFNGRVLGAASLDAAFTPVRMPFSVRAGLGLGFHTRDMGYGFGWFIDRHRRLREIWHTGGFPGFQSCLLRVPDENFTVAILENAEPGKSDADPLDLARQLEDIYLSGQAPAPAHP